MAGKHKIGSIYNYEDDQGSVFMYTKDGWIFCGFLGELNTDCDENLEYVLPEEIDGVKVVGVFKDAIGEIFSRGVRKFCLSESVSVVSR